MEYFTYNTCNTWPLLLLTEVHRFSIKLPPRTVLLAWPVVVPFLLRHLFIM